MNLTLKLFSLWYPVEESIVDPYEFGHFNHYDDHYHSCYDHYGLHNDNFYDHFDYVDGRPQRQKASWGTENATASFRLSPRSWAVLRLLYKKVKRMKKLKKSISFFRCRGLFICCCMKIGESK